MKTKYKIIIACTLVLSMLTVFAVTSFAAEVTSDVVYNNNTYTYNTTINDGVYLQIWDCDNIIVVTDTSTSYNYDYIIIYYHITGPGDLYCDLYYDNNVVDNYLLEDSIINIILSGDYKYGLVNSTTYSDNVTNINDTSSYEYDVFYNSSISAYSQINLLNNQPNPLDKVNDFLGYLSTALNKLTTMIITNQILILFIVAVPVVSFVIGSFKRIKDAGRV